MSINKVILVGNLGADPEVRYTSDELAVCNFSIATEFPRRNEDGEIERETLWHSIACFGKLAENAAKHLKKGRQVYLEGSLVPNIWEGKDGKKQTQLRVHASTIEFLGAGQAGKKEPVTLEGDANI